VGRESYILSRGGKFSTMINIETGGLATRTALDTDTRPALSICGELPGQNLFLVSFNLFLITDDLIVVCHDGFFTPGL
jgi:hypothetical protein